MFKLISTIYATSPIKLGGEVTGVGPFQTAVSGNVKSNLGDLLSNTITTITVVGSLAFVVYFTIGGLKWIIAGGDKGKIQESKDQMTQAAIGLIAMVASYFIIGIVGAVLGIDILNPYKTLFGNLSK